MIGWILLTIVVIIVICVVIYYFNRIIVLENRIDNSKAQIDVQLKKRADLVPNLVETVKGYVKHEREVLERITLARTSLMNSKSFEDEVKAGNQLQEALKSLFAVAENYPTLKANENFLKLQQELGDIEDKIAYARQHYNDSVLSYNNMIEKFPGNLFAKVMKRKEKSYLEITEEEKQNVKVSF